MVGGMASIASWPTLIAHLDVDAFYASVELLRRPELRGLPVIVSGSGPRAVVTTASYEARRFGIGSAMPTARARRLCPEAILVPPDFTAYREASRAVMARVRAQVERVEVVGLDEAYLDLEGLVAPRAAMRRLVGEVRAETGLDCSVGIGPNRLVAKVASDAEKPRGFVVLSREEAAKRFASEPPTLIPGIGGRTAERLERIGIRTLGELQARSVDQLRSAFGERHGPYLSARARFHCDSPVAEGEAKSRSVESTFDRDLGRIIEMEEVLAHQSTRLSEELRRRNLAGRTIAIKVKLDDFTTITRSRTVAEPTNDAATISHTARALLRAYAPPRPVRLLGVRVAAFAAPGAAVSQPVRGENLSLIAS